MTRIEQSIFIESSPEAVWNVGTYPDSIPQWFVGVAEVRTSGNFPEVGSGLDLVYRVAGIDVTLSLTVTDMAPYERLIFEMSGMVSGTNAWYHQPQDGGVWLTYVHEYELGGGPLGQIADRLIVEKQLEEQIVQSLANYKAFSES